MYSFTRKPAICQTKAEACTYYIPVFEVFTAFYAIPVAIRKNGGAIDRG
jgi:hypothetical protein